MFETQVPLRHQLSHTQVRQYSGSGWNHAVAVCCGCRVVCPFSCLKLQCRCLVCTPLVLFGCSGPPWCHTATQQRARRYCLEAATELGLVVLQATTQSIFHPLALLRASRICPKFAIVHHEQSRPANQHLEFVAARQEADLQVCASQPHGQHEVHQTPYTCNICSPIMPGGSRGQAHLEKLFTQLTTSERGP